MMYTSPKFESEEAARSQVEPLQIQQRPILGCHGGQSPPVQGVGKTRFGTGQTEPQTLRSATEAANNPVCIEHLETGYLTTSVVQAVCNRRTCTHYKLCGSDAMHLIGCCITCLRPCPGRLQWHHPLLVLTSVHPDAPAAIVRHDTQVWVAAFWRGSTWVLAASSDSSVGEVSSIHHHWIPQSAQQFTLV